MLTTCCAPPVLGECVDLFRSLAAHELKHDYDFESQNFLFMIPAALKKSPTAENLRSLSDAEVLKMLGMVIKADGGIDASLGTAEVKPRGLNGTGIE